MAGSQPDVFSIRGFMRFYLVVQLLIPLSLIGVTAWAVSSSKHIVLSDKGPLILAGLGLWALWELVSLVRWVGFSVAITDEGITSRGRTWHWQQIAAARAQNAYKFSTFIELDGTDGSRLAIPAAIEDNAFVLTLIEKYVPGLERRG